MFLTISVDRGVCIQKFYIMRRGYLTIITPLPYTKTYFQFGDIKLPKKRMSAGMINKILREFVFEEKYISSSPELLSCADILRMFRTICHYHSLREINEIYRIKYEIFRRSL